MENETACFRDNLPAGGSVIKALAKSKRRGEERKKRREEPQ